MGRCRRASRSAPSRRRARCAGLASPATRRDNPRLRLLIGSKGVLLVVWLPAQGSLLLRVARGLRCGWRGSNPHGLWPPASEAGAYPGSATSARRTSRRLTPAERAARSVMQPAADAAAGAVQPRVGPCGAPRAVRPWPDVAPASGVPRPGRGGGASPPPLCLGGRSRRPPSQRAPRAKSEISCGVAVSKPTTSSIPGSAGSAIEKPFETMPTTTSRASMPEAWR